MYSNSNIACPEILSFWQSTIVLLVYVDTLMHFADTFSQLQYTIHVLFQAQILVLQMLAYCWFCLLLSPVSWSLLSHPKKVLKYERIFKKLVGGAELIKAVLKFCTTKKLFKCFWQWYSNQQLNYERIIQIKKYYVRKKFLATYVLYTGSANFLLGTDHS